MRIALFPGLLLALLLMLVATGTGRGTTATRQQAGGQSVFTVPGPSDPSSDTFKSLLHTSLSLPGLAPAVATGAEQVGLSARNLPHLSAIPFRTTPLMLQPPVPGAAFGLSIAADGNRVLIGAVGDNDGVGAAYLFEYNGVDWVRQARLIPDDLLVAGFGAAVALDGDTALVGAPNTSQSSGAAYVFGYNGSTWQQQARLTAGSNARPFDQFGTAVAVDGAVALVGAPFEDSPAGSDAGAAYLFERTGDATWNPQPVRLAPPAGDSGPVEMFGQAVALSNGTALIGKPFTASAIAGAAYFFTRNDDGTWNSVPTRVTAGDMETVFDQFGSTVALSENHAIIGAPFKDAAGAAYVFVRTARGTWNTQPVKLTMNDPTALFDQFGTAVALHADRALVGAPFGDTNSLDTGQAYLFVRNGQDWVLHTALAATNMASGDGYGEAVALGAEAAFVGAPFTDSGIGTDSQLNDSGQVYAYRAPDRGTLTIVKEASVEGTQPFTFTSSIPGQPAFTLVDDGTAANQVSFLVDAGTYRVNESVPAGWELAGATCDNGDPITAVRVTAGASVTCTFTNTRVPPQPGTLTIVKEASVESTRPFTFTSSIPGQPTFSLIDDGKTTANRVTFDDLAAGTYIVTEQVSNQWKLADLRCRSDAASDTTTVDLGTATATVVLDPGEAVTCTFINVEQEPTAVSLVAFTAHVRADQQVRLAWETATEVDNAGFNLYRATSPDGPWVQLNDWLIPARGDAVTGARYEFVDTPTAGTTLYRLEDVDLNGVATVHGPIRASFETAESAERYQSYLPVVMHR